MMNLNRSLSIERPPDESLLKILERLAGEGYLQSNRQFICYINWDQFLMKLDCSRSSRFVKLICSLKNLEKLNLFGYDLTLVDLSHVFQSCSKLTSLYVTTNEYKMLEMDEHLKNQLKPGFQRLRCLDLVCYIDNDSWPVIQEMLT
jgi:hypothetical protein